MAVNLSAREAGYGDNPEKVCATAPAAAGYSFGTLYVAQKKHTKQNGVHSEK